MKNELGGAVRGHDYCGVADHVDQRCGVRAGPAAIHTAVNILPVNTCAADDATANQSTTRSAATWAAAGSAARATSSATARRVQQADQPAQGPHRSSHPTRM